MKSDLILMKNLTNSKIDIIYLGNDINKRKLKIMFMTFPCGMMLNSMSFGSSCIKYRVHFNNFMNFLKIEIIANFGELRRMTYW